MGSTPSPPAAPDPTTVAQQQTDTNVGTALANSQLSDVDQTDQFGDSIMFGNAGDTNETIDGQSFSIPQITENTTLGPQQQQLFNTTQSAEQGLATDANTLAGQAQTAISNPPNLQDVNLTPLTGLQTPNLSAANINNFTNTSFEQPFDNLASQEQEQLNQSLASQGIIQGGSNGPAPANGLGGTGNAYNNAQMNLGQELQGQQDTFDTASQANALSAIEDQTNTANSNLEAENSANNTNQLNQAGFNNQTALTASQAPLNELTGLLGLSQTAPASFQQTSQPTIPTTDTAQIDQNSFEDQEQNFNEQVAEQSANEGGLFGLGGSILGGLVKSGSGTSTAGSLLGLL
jgi:hypothetical protein